MIKLITALFNEKHGNEQAKDLETVKDYYDHLRYELDVPLHTTRFWITYKQEWIDTPEQLQRLLINYD